MTTSVTIKGNVITIIAKAANPEEYGLADRVGPGEAAVIIDQKTIIAAIRADRSVFEQREGESWRDVVARVGAAQGLKDECLECYDHYAGAYPQDDHQDHARQALLDWDALI